MSAAVIGRQLRQQSAANRISGPQVPPTQYKGSAQARAAAAAALSRARPSSFSSVHGRSLAQQQQSSSLSSSVQRTSSFYGALERQDSRTTVGGSSTVLLPSGADADKNFAKFSQLYSHEFYPHPAHRAEAAAGLAGERSERRGKRKDKKGSSENRRVFFSSRCWWVAVKAHCPGVVLVLVGTIMSVVGFYAESLSELEAVRLENGTLERRTDENLKAHLHNLTYVGPVIMGLGGMVLVAACVLTFEVRDTLGVQRLAAVGQEPPSPEKIKVKEKIKEKLAESDGRQKKSRTKKGGSKDSPETGKHSTAKGKDSQNQDNLPLKEQPPMITSKSMNFPSSNGYLPKSTYSSINLAGSTFAQEVAANVAVIEINNQKHTIPTENSKLLTSETTQLPLAQYQQAPNLHPKLNQHYHQQNLQTQPNQQHPLYTSVSTSDLFTSIDMSFVGCRIPSPAETELSDPEGCSLHTLTASGHAIPSRWRSRCSCSGSPTSSMVLALQCGLEGGDRNFYGASRLSLAYNNGTSGFTSQLPHRSSKILASVESDGLSASTTSSEWDVRGGSGGHRLMTSSRSSVSNIRVNQQAQQKSHYTDNYHHKPTVNNYSSPPDLSSYHHQQQNNSLNSRGSMSGDRMANNVYKGVQNSSSTSNYPLLELPPP